MKRDVLNAPRLNELKRRRRRGVVNKILILLLGLSAIFALLTYLSRLEKLNISEVEISGNKVIDTEIIKSEIEKQISGKYFWLFPKTNILFYPQKTIRQELQAKFSRLKEINLSIKDNKILEVNLIERTPSYTWCGTTKLESNSNNSPKCYFMDSEGYIFDEAPYFSSGVYFRFYGSAEINTYFLENKFKDIISLKNEIETFELNPQAFQLNDKGIGEFSLSPGSYWTPTIIFNLDSDFAKIAENLHTALLTEPLKSKIKNNYSSLLYIDLRFDNKVYYKFSNPSGN